LLPIIFPVSSSSARLLRSRRAATFLGTGLRLGLLPALLLAFALVIPAAPSLRAVLIVQASMPSRVFFPIILSKLYHGDMPTALRIVLGTSLLGLITIPLWLTFGMRFVH
jgi:predicted Na+-dependent transporter